MAAFIVFTKLKSEKFLQVQVLFFKDVFKGALVRNNDSIHKDDGATSFMSECITLPISPQVPVVLTLFHSERPNLYTNLAFRSEMGLN